VIAPENVTQKNRDLWREKNAYQIHEEQAMIRDMIREFTQNEVEPRDKWMDENGFDYDLHKKLCEAGLMGIHIPDNTAAAAAMR
jgi:alkylation response protein AidB-like acyl-CoA dehydrogenase